MPIHDDPFLHKNGIWYHPMTYHEGSDGIPVVCCTDVCPSCLEYFRNMGEEETGKLKKFITDRSKVSYRT